MQAGDFTEGPDDDAHGCIEQPSRRQGVPQFVDQNHGNRSHDEVQHRPGKGRTGIHELDDRGGRAVQRLVPDHIDGEDRHDREDDEPDPRIASTAGNDRDPPAEDALQHPGAWRSRTSLGTAGLLYDASTRYNREAPRLRVAFPA